MSSLAKVTRNGQVTLPANVRKALRVKEGDYLEVAVVEGEVRLRPISVVDRQAGWRRIREAQSSVRYIGPEPRPTPDEEERWVHDAVKEFRDRDA
jgi:AbrB family looped-hinge helix DNA binding protein